MESKFRRWYEVALLIWVMIGAYLEVPLVLGENYIPGIMLVAIAPVLAFFLWRDFKRSDFIFFGSFVLLTLASIALSPGFDFLFDKLKGAAQLFFSCGLMLLLLKAVKRTDGTTLYWCSAIAALTIGTGMAVEFFVPAAKSINDQIRTEIYSAGNSSFSYGIYENATRDEGMVGKDRATFLTSEPSCAAEGIMIFSICCLILRQDTPTIAIFIYANFCAFVTTGSPVIPLSVLAGLMSLLRFNLWRKPILLILGASLLVFSVTVPRVREVLDKQIERLSDGIDEYGDLSIYSRLGVPYLRALPTVVNRAPIFGVGEGGKNVLAEWSTDSLVGISPEFAVGTNSFVLVFLYFGLVGGTAYYFLFYSYLRANQIRFRFLFGIIWAAYGHTNGALESPRFWAYTGLLISAFWCRSVWPPRSLLRTLQPIPDAIQVVVEPLSSVPSQV
jgi:hypothetical protein